MFPPLIRGKERAEELVISRYGPSALGRMSQKRNAEVLVGTEGGTPAVVKSGEEGKVEVGSRGRRKQILWRIDTLPA